MSDHDGAATPARAERARTSLTGVACGDALGRPVDGDAAAAVRDRYGRVTEMLGADGRRAGTTTSPTAAAVRSAERLVNGSASAESTSADRSRSAARSPPPLAAGVPYGYIAGPADDRAAAAAEAVGRGDGGEAAASLAVIVGELVDGKSITDAVSTAATVAVARSAPVPLRETLAAVGDRGAVSISPRGDQSAVFETALHEAVAAAGAEEAIVSAVSRGGNASALGAVAGAVAGARFGANADAIPRRWLNELKPPSDLHAVADAVVDEQSGAGRDADQ
jgi:ADP-ribosyl-[dinitrogen reductase] hydrolase